MLPASPELARRFGELHDSVLRRCSHAFRSPGRIASETELVLEALAVDGTWWQLTLAVSEVLEFRFAEGAAVWENATTWEVTTHHPDGTATCETMVRDLADLRLGGPTNQVIFAAAIHVVPEGVFVDLSPYSLGDPATDRDPAAWRRSTFYVFGRSAEARLEPLGEADAVDVAAVPTELRARFLGNGATTMFHRRALFDDAVTTLENAGYRVHVIDASSAAAFREQMTRVMRFKECFGYEPWTGNLDALNDAFREVDYASTVGVVLAFVRFDALRAEDAHTAEHVLDILEYASRNALLTGRQLIGLVKSDDPRLSVPPVGARAPQWNDAEWLNSKRGI